MLKPFLTASLLILLALLVIDRGSLFLPPCGFADGDNQNEEQRADAKACAEREGIVVVGLKTLKTIPPEWWTAFATLAIAAFTYVLYRATNRQADLTRKAIADAEDTAKRELRAYPGIVGANIEIHSGKILIELSVINTSTTPAYKFRYGMKYEFCERDEVAVFGNTEFHDMQWDMAPHSKTTMRCSGQITEKQIAAVTFTGDLILMFGGRAEYEDAFGKARHIQFTYRCSSFRKETRRIEFPTGLVQGYEVHLCPEPDPISYESN